MLVVVYLGVFEFVVFIDSFLDVFDIFYGREIERVELGSFFWL